ncbi:hypothetical protein KFK09_019487 [Dendrobium nobile]|uniref:CCHC-type domain-containing protein n=1 Tax=Dendrobium nobile TaxID=94219 RepID=A0A8T3AR33_DENNO|nr:hypothetical protein KFK09_019487 [Dendrobium nobile]
MLCSFYDPSHVEAVLTNGPWFVNGNIVGIDRWTQSFNPNSLKGLTSPIWIRLPNLPLHCWDEINICRIASMVGKPYLIDGNMFQWSRREFRRICVRIELDAKLPTGVWVEGANDKFYQKIEYEKIPSLCYGCGKIGHSKDNCTNYIMENKMKNALPEKVNQEISTGLVGNNQPCEAVEGEGKKEYGPWMLVKYGKKKPFGNYPRKQPQRQEYKKTYVPVKKINMKEGENLVKVNVVNLETEKQQTFIREEDKTVQANSEVQVTRNSQGINDDNSFRALNALVEEGEIIS